MDKNGLPETLQELEEYSKKSCFMSIPSKLFSTNTPENLGETINFDLPIRKTETIKIACDDGEINDRNQNNSTTKNNDRHY